MKFKNKKITIIVAILVSIIIISIIFIKNINKTAKNFKVGNNSTSQGIVNNILNISSYQAEIEVTVISNKNENKYKIKQTYKQDEENTQEILEPSSIEGVKITKRDNTLEIENTKLNLKNILENYEEVTQNNLDLSVFIQDYKENEESKYREEKEQIIMETTAKTENKYQKYKSLYISKQTGKPEKMEIKDNNKNTMIYIIYKEIN